MKTTLEELQSSRIPTFLMNPEMIAQAKRNHMQALPTNGDTKWEDFSVKTPFRETLFLRAETWDPMPSWVFGWMPSGQKNALTFGSWRAYVQQLKPDTKLRLYQKKGRGEPRLGWVQFNKPVMVPTLDYHESYGGWTTMMSLTPQECISLNVGVRRAKGDVLITGLGLGYLLYQVSLRTDKVTSITVIEKDRELIDKVMPSLSQILKIKPKIKVGNCYDLVPKMKADVLLLDHYSGYGFNRCGWEEKMEESGNFGSVWVWG